MDGPVQENVRIEQRTIDHIPVTERHGRAWNLFTIWFGSNIMLLTVAFFPGERRHRRERRDDR